MIGLDTWVQMLAAERAANRQEEGIEEWQEHLEQLLADYGTADEDYLWTYVDPLADPAMAGVTNEVNRPGFAGGSALSRVWWRQETGLRCHNREGGRYGTEGLPGRVPETRHRAGRRR